MSEPRTAAGRALRTRISVATDDWLDVGDAILAIEREAAAPAATLDVERLRTATTIHHKQAQDEWRQRGEYHVSHVCDYRGDCTDKIAAEYARLSAEKAHR